MRKRHAQRTATRRDVLRVGAGIAAALAVRPADASTETMAAAIRSVVGDAPMQAGKVTLDVPLLVENGNSVPITVTVDHPMRPDDYVTTIAVFNEKNPQPNVAIFHLTPRSGRATASTRIRLADTQKLVAVARLSNGTFWSGEAEVIVTLPACAES